MLATKWFYDVGSLWSTAVISAFSPAILADTSVHAVALETQPVLRGPGLNPKPLYPLRCCCTGAGPLIFAFAFTMAVYPKPGMLTSSLC